MGVLEMIFGKKKTNSWAKEKEKKTPAEKEKVDLGVCVPNHAKTTAEKKKLKGKKEMSPFERLHLEHEKELGHEVKELMEQESEEPYDFAPELGVQSIATKKFEEDETEKDLEEKDELDRASEKMSQGYVPKFSASARKKLGYEEAAPLPKANEARASAEFEVTGIYVGSESMISGRVLSGRLTKRMTSQYGKNSIRISDLKSGYQSVSEISAGENGTIFTRTNAATLKSGEVLEFS